MDDDITIEAVVPGAWLRLSGRLSAGTVADVRLALREAVEAGVDDLVLGLAAVDLVDATGLGVLVATHRFALRSGRRLILRDVPPRVDRLLHATKLHRVLRVEQTVDSSAVENATLAG